MTRWLTLAVALATGCSSYSTYRTTRLASRDRTELLFAAQLTGAAVPGTNQAAPMPELAVSARRGVGTRFEVQATGTVLPIRQVFATSLELAGKARVAEAGRWSLAVGAHAGYRLITSGLAVGEGVHAAVPLIGGIELGRHQLVLSVTAGVQRWWSSGSNPVAVPFVGQSIGVLWRTGRRWSLLPEVGRISKTNRGFGSTASERPAWGRMTGWIDAARNVSSVTMLGSRAGRGRSWPLIPPAWRGGDR